MNQYSLFDKLNKLFINYLTSQFSLEKLSRKIQNWHELEFAKFINELNKSIKKVGGMQLDDTAKFGLMKLFDNF